MDIFDLSAKITLDSSGYEKGLDSAEKKGSAFGATIKQTLTNGVKIAAGAVAALGSATIALGAAFVKSTGDVAAYGDKIDKASQKMGISADAYQEWDAVLQHSGSSIDAMGRGMVTLSKQAQKGGDAFKKLGLSEKEVVSMSQEDLFSAVIAGLQNMEEGTERTALAAELLGGSAKELGPLLNTSAEATQAMKDRVHELGGVMSDEAVKAAANYQDKLQDMQTALGGLKRTMISDFLPGVSSVMDGLTEIFAGDSDEGIGLISEGIDSIIDKITEKAPKFLEVGSKIAVSIGEAIIDNLPKLAKIGGQIVTGLVNAIIKTAPKILKSGASIIKTLLKGLKQSLPDFLSSVAKIIPEVVKIITRELPSINAVGMEILQVLVDSIPEISSALFEAIQSMVDMIVDTLSDGETLQKMIDTGVTLFTSLIDNVSAIIQQIVEALPGLIDAICVALTSGGLLEKIIAAGVALFTALVENISGIVQAISEALPQIIDSIVTALTTGNLIEQIIDAGVTMFVALVENLSAIIEGIAEALPKIVDSVVTALTTGDLLMKIIEAGVTMFVALIENIDDIILGIAKSLPTLITKLVEALTSPEFLTKMSEAGIALLSGLVANIPGILAAMASGLAQLAKGIANSLKKTLDNLWDWVFGGSVSLAEDLESGLKTTHNKYGHTYGGHGGKYASGTSHAPRGVSLVGEYGPELVFLNGGEEIWSASKTKKALNMNRKSGNVSVSEKTDSRIVELLEAILEKNTTIRLDDGTVIGWMDRQLGRRAVQKARGN